MWAIQLTKIASGCESLILVWTPVGDSDIFLHYRKILLQEKY
jgi:hypothetical protein